MFELKNHIEINENYQGISFTEFELNFMAYIFNNKITDTFIRSNEFIYHSLKNCIKEEPDKGYLKRAFDFKKIKSRDFKKRNKEGTSKFLAEFENESDWGDDKNEFAKLVDKYFEIQNKFNEIDFYILSKDWFNKQDKRLIEPESSIYLYYFLILSINRKSNRLMTNEELKITLEKFIRQSNGNCFKTEIRNILLIFKNTGGKQEIAKQILEQLKRDNQNNNIIQDGADDILDIVTGWCNSKMRVWI
ncbi:hypothetical protein [Flavobacterium sp. I3-2]|uniref:hypothetical protein n=1 Tax=Flavobacterium sp. I3-2 TaxID=2748319 RepID=UPI001C4A479B|nr:hypothetical protein [Flavobacterium sp. I3-2]